MKHEQLFVLLHFIKNIKVNVKSAHSTEEKEDENKNCCIKLAYYGKEIKEWDRKLCVFVQFILDFFFLYSIHSN